MKILEGRDNMEKQWWKEGIVYQIYPRSFSDANGDGIGDLKGIIQKLDYLKELGIDIIWLSPVYKSPNDDNGYDISDYQDIMDEFGTMSDMELLISEVHRRNMKLIMDLVVNHTSDEHPWFIESRSSENNPMRDYYIWRKGNGPEPPNNWGSWFGGSAWEYDSTTDEYYLHIFSKKQPDLNWENPELREEIYKMMDWWLKKGIDGFRMDVINLISKDQRLPDGLYSEDDQYGIGNPYYINGPKVHDYLREMNQRVLAKYDIMTVGETAEMTPEIAREYVNSDRQELNMVFGFEHMGLDHGVSKWEKKTWSLPKLKKINQKWYEALKEKGWNTFFLNNHDQPRAVSRFGDDKKFRVPSAKMLATLLLTLPGTPFIYQGEEIGMTNIQLTDIEEYRDIETLNWYQEKQVGGFPQKRIMEALYQTSRDNARTPMQWDEMENAGFSTTTPWIKVNPNYQEINVRQAQADPDSILKYYQALIKLRHNNSVLVYGNYQLIQENHQQIYAYRRELNQEKVLILLNFSENTQIFNDQILLLRKDLLIANYPVEELEKTEYIKLQPYEARIYRL